MNKQLMKQSILLLENGVLHASVWVTATQGSSPQKEGASMLVTLEEIFGTVGGGAIEHTLIKEARKMIQRGPESAHFQFPLESLNMACGGQMDAFAQLMRPNPRLHIFGAGHCARALAPLAVSLGFDLFVSDHRQDWAVASAFPPETSIEIIKPGPDASANILEGDWVLVMTHNHLYDFEAASAALVRKPRFLGVLASRSKAQSFMARLQEAGFSNEDLACIHMPVGLPLGALGPQEIAVSIAAQLVQLQRKA